MIHGCPDCAPSMPCEKHEAREAAEAQVAQLTREKAELLSCPDHGPHLGFRYCPECYAKAFTEGQAASALHSQQMREALENEIQEALAAIGSGECRVNSCIGCKMDDAIARDALLRALAVVNGGK